MSVFYSLSLNSLIIISTHLVIKIVVYILFMISIGQESRHDLVGSSNLGSLTGLETKYQTGLGAFLKA